MSLLESVKELESSQQLSIVAQKEAHRFSMCFFFKRSS